MPENDHDQEERPRLIEWPLRPMPFFTPEMLANLYEPKPSDQHRMPAECTRNTPTSRRWMFGS